MIGISQLSANHLNIICAKGRVTDYPPETIDTHLHTSFAGISTTHQPHVSMFACAIAVNSNAAATGRAASTV